MRKQTFYLAAFVSLSVMVAIYEAILFWHGANASENLLLLCQVTSIVPLVLWIDADSKGRANVYRPYEFGQLIFLYWLPYLPFYLWKTRRSIGILMFIGFVFLFFLGYFAQWVIYLAR